MIVNSKIDLKMEIDYIRNREVCALVDKRGKLYVVRDLEYFREYMLPRCVERRRGEELSDVIHQLHLADDEEHIITYDPVVVNSVEDFIKAVEDGEHYVTLAEGCRHCSVYGKLSTDLLNAIDIVEFKVINSIRDFEDIMTSTPGVECIVEYREETDELGDICVEPCIDTCRANTSDNNFVVPRIGGNTAVDFKEILKDNKRLLDAQRRYMFYNRFLSTKVYSAETCIHNMKNLYFGAEDREYDKHVESRVRCMGKISHVVDYVEHIKKGIDFNVDGFSAKRYYDFGCDILTGHEGDLSTEEKVLKILKYAKECTEYAYSFKTPLGVDWANERFYIAISMPSCWNTIGYKQYAHVPAKELISFNRELKNLVISSGILKLQEVLRIERRISDKPVGWVIDHEQYIQRNYSNVIHYGYNSVYDLSNKNWEGVDSLLDKKAELFSQEDVEHLRECMFIARKLRKVIGMYIETEAYTNSEERGTSTGYLLDYVNKCLGFLNSGKLRDLVNLDGEGYVRTKILCRKLWEKNKECIELQNR